MCLFFHRWKTVVNYIGLNKRKGRFERVCKDCGTRQIKIDQFSERVKKEILKRHKTENNYVPYKKNDFTDIYTKYVLIQNLDQE